MHHLCAAADRAVPMSSSGSCSLAEVCGSLPCLQPLRDHAITLYERATAGQGEKPCTPRRPSYKGWLNYLSIVRDPIVAEVAIPDLKRVNNFSDNIVHTFLLFSIQTQLFPMYQVVIHKLLTRVKCPSYLDTKPWPG